MQWLSVPVPDIFGNYMLKELTPIILPNTLPLWPETPLSILLVGVFFLLIIFYVYKKWAKWHSNAYRREALKILDAKDISALLLLPSIMKNVAITAYTDPLIPGLIGKDWILFLNSTVKEQALFDRRLSLQLFKISYAPLITWIEDSTINKDLLNATIKWVKTHAEEIA